MLLGTLGKRYILVKGEKVIKFAYKPLFLQSHIFITVTKLPLTSIGV